MRSDSRDARAVCWLINVFNEAMAASSDVMLVDLSPGWMNLMVCFSSQKPLLIDVAEVVITSPS